MAFHEAISRKQRCPSGGTSRRDPVFSLLLGTLALLAELLLPVNLRAEDLPAAVRGFLETHCFDCHDPTTKKGSLDLAALAYEPSSRVNFSKWVFIHDRVAAAEMPPKDWQRPTQAERNAFLTALNQQLARDDQTRISHDGRALQRRLNLDEYENALRDLLGAPWLQVKSKFPPDGEASGYNKPSAALDLSHVQLERYLSVAEEAIDEVMQQRLQRPDTPIKRRFYARDQDEITTFFTGNITFIERSVYKRPFPVLGFSAQPDVRLLKSPLTVGESNPEIREQEALGQLARFHENFRPHWNQAKIPASGLYRIRISGYSLSVAAGHTTPGISAEASNLSGYRGPPREISLVGGADVDSVLRSQRNEPVSILALRNGDIYFGERRAIGAEFDLTPEPTVHELGPVWLRKNEILITEPMRLFRPPPPQWKETRNPLATADAEPAVAFRWLEIEGPLPDPAADEGVRLLFGDLPLKTLPSPAAVAVTKEEPMKKVDGVTRSLMRESGVERPKPVAPIAYEVLSATPRADAEKLLREFLQKAYRHQVEEADVRAILEFVLARLDSGANFKQAMTAAYKAVLSSPGFLLVEERPGLLDDHALATRLSLFLWDSPPDQTLRQLAAQGELRRPEVLRAQTDRLLNDPKSSRFVQAFLDYWLDLRKRNDTEPSATLYNDYFGDDFLSESALRESRLFFADLIARDLPARNIVDSDFTYLNERLAKHYEIPGVEGIAMRRVALPAASIRGGFLTQAIVLKVTSCGTTTSPVIRGKWMNERIMGIEIPPPPAAVPAVEPDIRGATTLREQLAKHRTDANCSSCHLKIDPPGFALESFDVMGGFREHYRAVDETKPGVPGHGYNGVRFEFHQGPPVDATGQFPDGTPFHDIREFKARLRNNEAAVARNLVRHLLIHATAASPTFGDRATVDAIMHKAAMKEYGIRTLILEIVQSDLFRRK